MPEVKFCLSRCCRNCEYRGDRISSSIYCTIDKEYYNEIVSCPRYKITSNQHILAAEKLLLPHKFTYSLLSDWIMENNLVIH